MEQKIGEGIGFERIRRITGYLANEVSWNNAKLAELADRETHSMTHSNNKDKKTLD